MNLIGVKEVADHLNVTPERIRQLVAANQITTPDFTYGKMVFWKKMPKRKVRRIVYE